MARVPTASLTDCASDSLRVTRARLDASCIVRFLVAGVLIVASVLKGYALATDPFVVKAVQGPRWLGVTIVELEFLLGVWLLSGLASKAARRVAIICFIAFACVSLSKALSGEASCGCFGKLSVTPWFSVVVSLVAIGAMAMFSPGPVGVKQSRLRVFGMIAALAVAAFGGARISKPSWLAGGQNPGLVCDDSSHDFGTINPAQTARSEHVFVLHNTSDHPIRILETSTTCGCTTATTATRLIEPGQNSEVRVALDWKNRIGQRLEEVVLLTDDKKTKRVQLSIRARVRPTIRVSPPAINFGLIESEAVARRIVSVDGGRQEDLRIVSVDFPRDVVSIARITAQGVPDPTAPLEGAPGSFELTFKPANESGQVSAGVIFHVNSPEQPRLELPVRAERRSDMVASPASVLLRRAPQGFEPQIVRIVSKDNPTVQITAGDFSVERVGSLDENSRAVVVRCTSTSASNVLHGNLQISNSGRTVNVPLMAVAF